MASHGRVRRRCMAECSTRPSRRTVETPHLCFQRMPFDMRMWALTASDSDDIARRSLHPHRMRDSRPERTGCQYKARGYSQVLRVSEETSITMSQANEIQRGGRNRTTKDGSLRELRVSEQSHERSSRGHTLMNFAMNFLQSSRRRVRNCHVRG